MYEDDFYRTHQGEIFIKSRCMQHESEVMDFFRDCLLNLNYHTNDVARRVWKKDQKTVVVCLADDFNVCGANLDHPPGQWFDNQTTVITDNYIKFETRYTVCQLPISYFGIFSYTPEELKYEPKKRFNFSVNRLDTQRLLIFLEYINQCRGKLDKDFVNFNAWDANGSNDTLENLQTNLSKYWSPLKKDFELFQDAIVELSKIIPIKNHNLSIEQANVNSWLVPVVETYSGNHTMAFSEKIFRALQTPVPWTVYSATGAVRYLQGLGFDVLDDLIDHSYNDVTQDSPWGIKKIKRFIEASLSNAERLMATSVDTIQARSIQAAQHNQTLLAQWRRQWPMDFANWLPDTINKIL